jgi:hypothetical protein
MSIRLMQVQLFFIQIRLPLPTPTCSSGLRIIKPEPHVAEFNNLSFQLLEDDYDICFKVKVKSIETLSPSQMLWSAPVSGKFQSA